MRVDISPFAGRTGELRFSGGSGNLDFIQFSSSTVPEPSVVVLLLVALSVSLLAWRGAVGDPFVKR